MAVKLKPSTKVKLSFIKGKSLAMLSEERKALEKQNGGALDEEFIKALYIDYMSDPSVRMDPKAKITFCDAYGGPNGLNVMKLIRTWEKDPAVQAEVRKVVRERFGGGERVRELYDQLWVQAKLGRISAIRLALELVGEYTPKLQHIDRPKSLEDYLDKMDGKDAKEDSLHTKH